MFKRGAGYTREQIARIARPENPPRGGDWATGYSRIGNDLYVFMNIGVPGRTGHDFENFYDDESQTLIWFSKPNKHSSNPMFQKILRGELSIYFFGRWSQRSPFTFLGQGFIAHFEDNYCTPQGYNCIRMVVNVKEIQDIIASHLSDSNLSIVDRSTEPRSSFLLEKHLEDFLVHNWDRTPLSEDYQIYERDGIKLGRQFPTKIGPIDILSQKKDKSDFLVVELKRDRATDAVVGQTMRYMGWVKENLCGSNLDVRGCIISQSKDEKLEYALKATDKIDFMKFEVDFRLIN